MNEKNKCPYPADPRMMLEQIKEIMPYFEIEDIMEGYLAMMVHRENRTQKDWIYTLEYYGGKWNIVKYRDYAYEFVGRGEIVRRDSDAVNVIGLASALAAMRTAAETM